MRIVRCSRCDAVRVLLLRSNCRCDETTSLERCAVHLPVMYSSPALLDLVRRSTWRQHVMQLTRVLPAAACVAAASLIVAGCDGAANGGAAAPPAAAVSPARDVAPDARSAGNLELVGHNDLQARSAYQPIVHAYGERRILFVGHHAGEAMNSLTGKLEK